MKRKEKRRQRIKQRTEEVIEAYRSAGSMTDPNGMYTGNTSEADNACLGGKIYIPAESCIPTQDADDL